MNDAINKKSFYLRTHTRRIMANAGALRGNTSQWIEDALVRYEALVDLAKPSLTRAQWQTLVGQAWAKAWSAESITSAHIHLQYYAEQGDLGEWAESIAAAPAIAVQACVAAYFANLPLGPQIAMSLAGMSKK
jgi:hypothetical protein